MEDVTRETFVSLLAFIFKNTVENAYRQHQNLLNAKEKLTFVDQNKQAENSELQGIYFTVLARDISETSLNNARVHSY